MGQRNDTDKAIRNIMNWADRPEWSTERRAVFDAHLTPVCEHIGLSQEELCRELAEHDYMGMLFGVMFEDFLTRRLPPDNATIIDDYLKRRGWRESVAGRHYLQQLRDAMLSLYEVVEVSPGHHCDVRNLVCVGKTIRVHEHLGTQNLVKWDRIAARIMDTNGKHTFSGGILPYPPEASQSLLRDLTESRKQFNKKLAQEAGKKAVAKMLPSKDQDDLFLRGAGPTFTSIWLIHTLEALHAPLPEMVNRDGEALVFTETRFPFPPEHSGEIARRMDTAREWKRDNPSEHTWTWLAEPDAGNTKPQRGLAIETSQDGQRPISGTLELKPGALMLTTNSMERTERGKEMLEALLKGFIGPALSKLQTPEQLLAGRDAPHGNRAPAGTLDPEVAAQVIRQMMDQHYRQCLDEPIPALDNKTPRQCARSKKGRAKVIEWLKYLENNELHRTTMEGQEPYDSRWMWEELKLLQYRS